MVGQVKNLSHQRELLQLFLHDALGLSDTQGGAWILYCVITGVIAVIGRQIYVSRFAKRLKALPGTKEEKAAYMQAWQKEWEATQLSSQKLKKLGSTYDPEQKHALEMIHTSIAAGEITNPSKGVADYGEWLETHLKGADYDEWLETQRKDNRRAIVRGVLTLLIFLVIIIVVFGFFMVWAVQNLR